MVRIGKYTITACLLMATAAMTGCGENNAGKSMVFGTVTYQGQPVGQGQIRFIPSGSGDLPMAATLIKDGKYKFDRKGGVPKGEYKVSIEAYRVLGQLTKQVEANSPPGPPVTQEQYLPEKFNRATTLTITVDENSSSQSVDFNLAN